MYTFLRRTTMNGGEKATSVSKGMYIEPVSTRTVLSCDSCIYSFYNVKICSITVSRYECSAQVVSIKFRGTVCKEIGIVEYVT